MAEPTMGIEDFHAHAMYLTHCRRQGQIGVAWLCMDDTERERYRKFALVAYKGWLEMEQQLARLRAEGNPRAFFVP